MFWRRKVKEKDVAMTNDEYKAQVQRVMEQYAQMQSTKGTWAHGHGGSGGLGMYHQSFPGGLPQAAAADPGFPPFHPHDAYRARFRAIVHGLTQDDLPKFWTDAGEPHGDYGGLNPLTIYFNPDVLARVVAAVRDRPAALARIEDHGEIVWESGRDAP